MSDLRTPSTASAWAAYAPDEKAPWDLRRVVHLHRRAGFAATWSEIQRDLKDGPQASVDRLLAGNARTDGVPENFAYISDLLVEGARDPERLKAWWIYRMLFGPDSLTERLTLSWHDHFATSNVKVHDVAAMRRQNELFREHARGPFDKLLNAVIRDPAMLLWLDASANRKEHPNENLARELMELFTLGIGHYGEADVKEAARALTGWTLDDAGSRFRNVASRHDDGEKTILGKTGKFNGDDLVQLLLNHPATAERLAARLCGLFMGEKAVEADAIRALAVGLREHGLDIGWGVETILRSQAFFAEANLGTKVLGPIEYLVGAARALELFDRPPSTLVLADWAARLGQNLFYPPNVGGWPGGRAWLSTRAVIGRANYAAALIEGKLTDGKQPFDAIALAERHGRKCDLDDLMAFYYELLLGGAPPPEVLQRLKGALGQQADAKAVRHVVLLILASAEAQLG